MRKRKPRSLHCSSRKQDEIRARAKAAEKTVTHYVLDLVLADDPDRHPLVLTAGEQREQLEMLRHCDGVTHFSLSNIDHIRFMGTMQ